MSLNIYDKNNDTLNNIAAGQRTVVYTKDSYEAAKIAGTLPRNCCCMIIDDCEDDTYSTDEQKTGKFWIDGKPIYRKVIEISSLPAPTIASDHHVTLSTNVVDTLINANLLINCTNSSGSYQLINGTRDESVTTQFQTSRSAGSSTSTLDLFWKTTVATNTYTGAKAIVEYTKISD